MKLSFVVANQQDVPPVPLNELGKGRTGNDAILVESVVFRTKGFLGIDLDPREEQGGWFITDWYTMSRIEDPSDVYDLERVDEKLTLARTIQPGERIIITIEG